MPLCLFNILRLVAYPPHQAVQSMGSTFDHINGYMDNVVDFIRAKHQLEKNNLMGICMGGTFSVIYRALHPEKVKNLVTTVTPTNFDTKKGLLHVWMEHIEVDRVVDTYGNLPAERRISVTPWE